MHIEFTINLQAFYMWGFYYVLGMVGLCFLLLALVAQGMKNVIATVFLWPITVLVLLSVGREGVYLMDFVGDIKAHCRGGQA